MKLRMRAQLANRKHRLGRRLDEHDLRGLQRSMFTASNLHGEIADRTRGLAQGGIAALHALT